MAWGQKHIGPLKPVLSTVLPCFGKKHDLRVHVTSIVPCYDWRCIALVDMPCGDMCFRAWFFCPGIRISWYEAESNTLKPTSLPLPEKGCPWDAEQIYSASHQNACVPGNAQVMDGA
jgi:hypothetical protein